MDEGVGGGVCRVVRVFVGSRCSPTGFARSGVLLDFIDESQLDGSRERWD